MEKLIKYITEHNSTLVISLVSAISVTFLLIVFFYIRQKNKAPSSTDMANLDNIEGALRRVLEDQNWQHEESATQSDKSQVLQLEQRIKSLQDELKIKAESVATSNVAPSPQDEQEKQGLLNKLKELEAKLAEYAIIEDDIADLNAYKKENQSLKEQLNKAKSNDFGKSTVVAAETPVADIDTTEQENIFGEFEKVVKNQNANQAISDFSKKVNEKAPTPTDLENIPQAKVVVKPETSAGAAGGIEVVESEEGTSAYATDVPKDTAKEAELFVKDFQGLFPKE